MHESKYGPQWTVSSKSINDGGDECLHLARRSDELDAQYRRETLHSPIPDGVTHFARDEHGGWLAFNEGEVRAFVAGAKAGDFDHLLSAAADSLPGDKMKVANGGDPDMHLLESALFLLSNAQPHGVLDGTKSVEWSRAFEQWRNAYHLRLSAHVNAEWSCSA